MSDPLLTEMLRMVKFESHLIVVSQWNAKVTVLIGGTYEQHLEEFKKRRLTKAEQVELADYLRDKMKDAFAVTLQSKCNPGCQFVYFPKKPDLTRPVVVGTVAHELVHVTFCILKRAQIRLTESSEEAYTYLHGYLMEKFWERIDADSPAK